jgi:hypothetical protein
VPLEPPSSPFALVILEIRSRFLPRQPGSRSSYFMFPAVAGMTGSHYTPGFFFSVVLESCKHFCSAGLEASLYKPPAKLGMTGVCYPVQLLVEVGSCDLFIRSGLEPQSS